MNQWLTIIEGYSVNRGHSEWLLSVLMGGVTGGTFKKPFIVELPNVQHVNYISKLKLSYKKRYGQKFRIKVSDLLKVNGVEPN